MSNKLNKEDVKEFIQMWPTNDVSLIASRFNVSRTYVYYIADTIRKMGCPLDSKSGGGGFSLRGTIRSVVSEMGYSKEARRKKKSRGGGISKRMLKNTRVMPFVGMAIGEVMKVERNTWDVKSVPTVYLGNYRKRFGMDWTTRTLPDGWEVTRSK